MKTFLATCAATLLLLTTSTTAQEPPKDAKPPAAADAKAPDANPPKEETWPSDHSVKINGQSIAYKATASTTLLKDEKGEPTALIYSTAYTRNDTKDFTQRPIAFLYNGGPGSASIWLHMGAFGPRRTKSKTTLIPCSIKPTWFSLIRSAPVSVTPSARRRTRISGAWIRT